MQEALAQLLRKRKQRCVAIILGIKDREVDPHLPKPAQEKLRKVIIDQVGEFYEFVVDLMGTLDTGEVVLNEDFLAKLDHKLDLVHEAVIERFPLRPEASEIQLDPAALSPMR